ncbi:hypothetical protein QBC47DRAFT_420373 [Echria macrotheca]|uniref:Uncharacterized protein n=1 Tax=Echria macrotheca TaxID=438768 RepID=A0AAJ0BJH4_9PEZI|nr:hypothetical protein QBC47DRAFT_420373 [Echria macrotheca]
MLKAVKRSRGPGMGADGVVGQREQESTQPPLDPGPGPVSAAALQLRAPSRQGRQLRNGPQNSLLPPVLFPGGRNPYLERPLPPPPPPKTPKSSDPVTALAPPPAPLLLPRPSTSSGPAFSKPAMSRPNFEKRLSKDDMSLTGQMGMSMGRTKGYQQYRFGIRSNGLPTPEPSPDRMPSPPPLLSTPYRTPTPNSISSGEIQIGMALGSPTTYTPSPLAGWQPQQRRAITPPRDTYSPPPLQLTPEPPIQRQKTQKRKFFGSLFGSRKHVEQLKAPEPAQNNYTTAFPSMSNSSLTRSGETTPLRSNTVTNKKASKFKPTVARSRTESEMDNTIQETKKQMPEVMVTSARGDSAEPSAARPALGGPGFLDIEIPDIRLERYSIMFSGVLNPQGTATSSSLLARRQATLEKLKNINDKIAIEEEIKDKGLVRRASSPQPTKSPAFSLFPPPQGHQIRTSPRLRSNTSPAHLPSPLRASFDVERPSEARPRKESKRVTIVSPRTMDERNRAANVEKLREQQIQMHKDQARQPAPVFDPEESTFLLDSPQSVSDVEEIIPTQTLPLKPRIQEPQWEIISPPSTSTPSETSSTATKRTASSTSLSTSSIQTTVTRPSIEINDDEDAALKAAVEISIARQISISRQQRNIASAKVNPVSNGLAGRVLESKQSVPRLVDMHRDQYRKSERVVLEAA